MWEERQMQTERDGEAVLRQTERATEDALRRRKQKKKEKKKGGARNAASFIRFDRVFDHLAVAGFTCLSDQSSH